MRYAGFWVRLWAVIVDFLIFLPFGFAQTVFEKLMDKGSVGGASSNILLAYVLFLIAGFVIQWLYSACFESGGWQATPGKRLMGLRVTDLQGDRISFVRATGRYFSKILSSLILCIGYIMVGVTDKKQGLHDKIADTLVLRGKAGDEEFHSGARQSIADDRADTMLLPTSNPGRWVMAGFDDQGHVVRLTFRHDNPKLDDEGLIIGRDSKSCDLHLHDQSVSRRHARLFKNQGRVWIEELGSINATIVSGQPLKKGGSVVLPSEGNITLGAVELSIAKY
jgi:uncharacterized RDD family membrane protein YckC